MNTFELSLRTAARRLDCKGNFEGQIAEVLCHYDDPYQEALASGLDQQIVEKQTTKRIRELSEDMFKYGEAQLYPALRKLEESGYVTAEWVVQEGKPNRRVYSITEDGSKYLWERQQEFAKFVDKVNAVMRPARTWAVNRG